MVDTSYTFFWVQSRARMFFLTKKNFSKWFNLKTKNELTVPISPRVLS